MMLFKILSFLGGYITIILPKICMEKFINLATSRGIFLWGVINVDEENISLKVRLSGVKPLRHVARITRCRFRIIAKAGLPFAVKKISRRKGLLLGSIFFLVSMYMLSSFVWFIEITGTNLVEPKRVEQIAREAGLYRGVAKFSLDSARVEDRISRQVPEISWVGVYIDGTRAQIKIVERVLPPDEGLDKKVDVVAVKDGVVKEILVLRGHPLVKEGDTVKAGQVLISSAIPAPEQTPGEEGSNDNEVEEEIKQPVPPAQYVHARGIVRARVWYEEYEEMELEQRKTTLTGSEISKLCIKINAKEIILMGPKKVPFAEYDLVSNTKRIPTWRNISLPVELISLKYLEKNTMTQKYNRDEATRLAGEHALANITSALPHGARIIDKQLREVNVVGSEDFVRVKALVETIEEIGVERNHWLDGGGNSVLDGKRGSTGSNG